METRNSRLYGDAASAYRQSLQPFVLETVPLVSTVAGP